MRPRLWEVVGSGRGQGGILVRDGRELRSAQQERRLATGSVLEEQTLIGGRLRFSLVRGAGPETGWVSINVGGQDLVVRVAHEAKADPPPEHVFNPPSHLHQVRAGAVLAETAPAGAWEVVAAPALGPAPGPEDDDYDWGAVLWDPKVECATFRVTALGGAALWPADLDDGDAAPRRCGQERRRLGHGEEVRLALGPQPRLLDAWGLWVRVFALADERSAPCVGEAPPSQAARAWWAPWGALALLPVPVTSAAHEETRVDRVLRGGGFVGGARDPASQEEYQKAWLHRMGWATNVLGSSAVANFRLAAYLRRAARVVAKRDAKQKRPAFWATHGAAITTANAPEIAASPQAARLELPLPTARALVPGAVRGRVTVVCPTGPRRHHLHALLYKCFDEQQWPDLELVVLDTGGEPSPFFAGTTAPIAAAAAPLLSSSASVAPRSAPSSPREDPRVVYVHVRDYPLSLGQKRNQLVQLASGEVVAHFDDDNLYAPQYVPTMVAKLRLARAQLARLSASFGWRPATDAIAWHADLADRAETFVHLRGPLSAVAFADEDVGEEAGVAASCVRHDVEDTFGVFLHVDHGGNVSSYQKEQRSGAEGRDIANVRLRALLASSRPLFLAAPRTARGAGGAAGAARGART